MTKAERKKKLAAAMRKRWKSPAFRAKMKAAARKAAKHRKRTHGRFKNPTFVFKTKKVWRLKRPKKTLSSRKNFKRGRGWLAIKAPSVRALVGRPKKGLKRWARWKKGGRHAAHRNPASQTARLTRLEKKVNILARSQQAILRTVRGELHQLPGGKAHYDVSRGLKAYQAARAREEAFLDRAAALEAGARKNPTRGRRKKHHGRRHTRRGYSRR